MQQAVERMVKCYRLAAAVRVLIEVQQQPRHRDTDAGINGSHLHSGALCYRFARCCAAEEKGVVAAHRAVLGLVPGFEQP